MKQKDTYEAKDVIYARGATERGYRGGVMACGPSVGAGEEGWGRSDGLTRWIQRLILAS